MRIAGIEFPQPLLDALHDRRLVVFAGAGVSMGPPANLPDFDELAHQISEGTGQARRESEPVDEFLRRLKDAGTDVHRLAALFLTSGDPGPSTRHHNLLRLYVRPEDVRIVTTNFDLLFEQAADAVFDQRPRVFEAPALPLGNDFQGIVHIHGSINEPTRMVLDARDLGQAYLTEADGWARTFLISLFTNYTVLFVGYSHSDTIVSYLTRSLPREETARRFALIGDQSDEPERWRTLGVEPIRFQQAHSGDYIGLDTGLAGLVDHAGRNILDWRRKITTIAIGSPPVDGEDAAVIEHTLGDPILTRFFVETAELPEWIDWLDGRGYLTALFADGDLSESDRMLARWLTSRFAMAHDEALFRMIQRHGSRLNPGLWRELSWDLQRSISQSPDAATVARWVLFLAHAIPAGADETEMSWIAEAGSSIGSLDGILLVYEEMTAQLSDGLSPTVSRKSEMLHYEMQKLLEECIRPNLDEIAEPVLALTTMRLNARHSVLTAWEDGDATWHLDNLGRSAIEPHGQDNLSQDVDPLIDTARECLEWLALNRVDAARLWSERYIKSQAPLLRRLAVHTLSARTDLSPDDKIAWLLENHDVHEPTTHHEVFRATADAYPYAGAEQRSAMLKAVLAYRAPRNDWSEQETETDTARHHHRWFHWLHKADPDCAAAKRALDDILEQHPELSPQENPAFISWSQTVSVRSPWTAEELLAKPAAEWLSDLVAFQPTGREISDGLHRSEMLRRVGEAVEKNAGWGLDLADAMASERNWNVDLWQPVIQGWAMAELGDRELVRVLSHLCTNELHKELVRDIVSAIWALARKALDPGPERWLDKANAIATALRPYAIEARVPAMLASADGIRQETDWYSRAISHPSGKLAEFWVQSTKLWCNRHETPPLSLNDEYRAALDSIMEDDTIAGKLGRTILAKHLPFLVDLDEIWAQHNLVPMLDPGHGEFLLAWDGLTYCGPMSSRTAGLLRVSFLTAVEHINRELAGSRRKRFVSTYGAMLTWCATSPTDEWITKLFTHGDAEVRCHFAAAIGTFLRHLDETRQKEWWRIWLGGYWQNRLLGVPVPLDDCEIEAMLNWTILLPAVYSEAVDLAIQMRTMPLQSGSIMRRVNRTDLVDRYPAAVAKLLRHLGKANHNPWIWYGADEIFHKLLQSDLDDKTKADLTETMARIGL